MDGLVPLLSSNLASTCSAWREDCRGPLCAPFVAKPFGSSVGCFSLRLCFDALVIYIIIMYQ